MKYLTNLNSQEILFISWSQYTKVSSLDTSRFPKLNLEKRKIELYNSQCRILETKNFTKLYHQSIIIKNDVYVCF